MYIHTYIHACMHTYICVCIYIYIYTHDNYMLKLRHQTPLHGGPDLPSLRRPGHELRRAGEPQPINIMVYIVYIYIYIHMYICIYVCVYIYIYILLLCMHICMYIYIYIYAIQSN